MKHNMKIIKTIASIAVLAFASNSAYAAGTIAGTGIDNTASISYSVGGTAQTDIESSEAGNSTPGAGSPTSFIVDRKVDLNVTASAPTSANIIPSGTQDHTFTLTNEGNDIEFINLTTLNTTGSDDFDVASCTQTVTAVTGTLPATTNPVAPAINSSASPLRIAPDGTATITMTCTAPASTGVAPLVNTDTADVSLIATAVTTSGGTTAVTATVSADNPSAKDTVLADAIGTAAGDIARDAAHSDTVTYIINTAAITVAKTQAVTKMAFDTTGDGSTDTDVTTGNLYAIPGSTIQYTITVTNTGAEADHIVISDLIPTNLTYVAASCSLSGDGVVNAAAPDAGVALGCSEAAGTVSSTSFTLPDGSTTAKVATLTIDATVN